LSTKGERGPHALGAHTYMPQGLILVCLMPYGRIPVEAAPNEGTGAAAGVVAVDPKEKPVYIYVHI
jgi:hypothetical protein